jgi:hypoxanthine phosphoribosyltransferase
VIRVRTVGVEEFRRGCGDLWDLARRSFEPNIVVGIRHGGWQVAEGMRAARALSQPEFLPLTCRRASSDVKEGSALFRLALQKLPYPVLNVMRLAEYYGVTLARCRAVRARGPGPSRIADPAAIDAIADAAGRITGPVRALIVDDSLDSGATLAHVMALVRQLLPTAEMRIAAYTVLGPYPIVAADYALHHRVNCRFPWSYDFHG